MNVRLSVYLQDVAGLPLPALKYTLRVVVVSENTKMHL